MYPSHRVTSDQVGKAEDRAYVLNHYARLILSVEKGLKKTKTEVKVSA